ncbi:MAG TPA: GNAT family N-acetyltransferase [Pseudomonadales bacterium]
MSPVLLADRLDSLYLTNPGGGLTAINQWDGGTVPRFHLTRSPYDNHWRFGAGLADPVVRELEQLCRMEPIPTDLRDNPKLADRALALLGLRTPDDAHWRGPVYAFPDGIAIDPATEVIPIVTENAGLLETLLPQWLADVPHRQPFFAALRGSDAVAVCASVRIGNRVHEAGVETHPAYRNQGLAQCVVGAWAKAVRQRGAEPVYSTSWQNTASQAVARGLGLMLIAEDFRID